MTPTDEQKAIIEAAVTTNESLLINALAGAAKTTTLELVCKALPPDKPILSLAFNKRIAEALSKKLPPNTLCKTMNSIGHSAWSKATGRRLIVDTKKNGDILKGYLNDVPRHLRYELDFAEIMDIVRKAKSRGYVPQGKYPDADRFITKEEFYGSLDEEPSPETVDAVEEVLLRSINLAFGGFIDFDDQIYMPVIFGGSWPQFRLVMGDEAQDFNPLNHRMLRKLVVDRFMAVGDPYQSIYAFRGAHTQSMSVLKEWFNMREMILSISFRNPISVVRRARERAPHMRWRDDAPEGLIATLGEWNHRHVPDSAAIICRNNAPLFSMALNLLRDGRGCQLVGSDLGPGLIRIMKKLGDERMTQAQTFEAIERWSEEHMRKARNPGVIYDKAECLRVFASFGNTLSEAIGYAEHLFKSEGPIQLLSGHKAKGLEWDTVFHLDPWRIPSKWATSDEDIEQEKNVKYVIETRPKQELFLASVTGFHSNDASI